MTEVVTIISLLPIICTEYQELRLIHQLNNFFNFDHNVLLLDSTTDTNRFINKEEEIIPQSLYIFENIADNITGLNTLTSIKSKNTFMIVVLESGEFQGNLNFLHQLRRIQRLQIKMKIGVFFSQFVSIDDLRNLFEWCKEHQIVNIFAAIYAHSVIIQEPNGERPLNSFTFEPFGAFYVVNVTGEEFNNYFRSYNSNFQQHQMRLGSSFRWSFNENFWLTTFRLMNASFAVEQITYSSFQDIYKSGIDILPRLETFHLKQNYMYPFEMHHMVIAVPEALPYAEFSSFLRAVTSAEFFGYTLITIAANMLLLTIFRYIRQKKILVFQSVADVLNLLMNDNGNIQYQRLSHIEGFLIVPLTFIGFVIVNGILSNLQSYLTRPVIQPQINTIQDIYSSPFPILTYSEMWKTALTRVLINLTNEDWSGKVFALPIQKVEEEIFSYNTTNSYFVPLSDAEFVVRAQKRLNVRGFRIPQVIIFSGVSSYFVNDKFLFFERLNEISFLIRSAGLWELWWRRYLDEMDYEVMEFNLERLKSHKETEIENFHIPMFIVYAWSASIVVLFIEIVWKNIKFSQLLKIVRKKFGQFCRSIARNFGR